jgi:hypothetical protein
MNPRLFRQGLFCFSFLNYFFVGKNSMRSVKQLSTIANKEGTIMKTKLMSRRTICIAAMLALYIAPSAAQQFSGYANDLMQVRASWDCALFWLDTLKNDTVITVKLPATYILNTDVHSTTSIYAGKNDPGTCPNGQRWHTYRMCYWWNISSIPFTATIKSAAIEIWYTASSQKPPYEVSFSFFPFSLTNWINDAGKVWSACSLGTAYSTHRVDCTIQTKYLKIDYPGSHQFCRDIANNLPSQAFALDIATNDDQIWTRTNLNRYLRLQQSGNAVQSVKLTINYTFPIDVTVQNGIPGNADTVTVDGTRYLSPHQFIGWTSSDPHTLLAKTVTLGGTTYSPTGWINKTRTEPPYPNPATVHPIENTTYEATFAVTSLPVTVYQKFSHGNLTHKLINGNLVPVGVDAWNGVSDFIPKPNPWTTSFNVGTDYCLRGIQDYLHDYDWEQLEKYNNWDVNAAIQSDIRNHRVFAIYPNTSTLTSNFQQTTEGSTIRADLLDAPGNYSNLTVQFKDPWLIDYPDPNYGNKFRNQGMSAPLKNRPSPFYPNLSNNYGGDVYKGIFTDQTIASGTYYSVGAPASQSFTVGGRTYSGIFQNWTGSYSYFQNASAQQTGVVFTSSIATVTAQYKGIHLSNTASAFSNNSQRKLVQTKVAGNPNWLHQVYTSSISGVSHVWIEHSSDGGATWVLGNNGQPLDGSAGGKCPCIAYTYDALMNYNYIGVVWQQPSGQHYVLCGKMFNQYAGSANVPSPTNTATIYTETADASSVDANPNLILGQGLAGTYLITFERKTAIDNWPSGINFIFGYIDVGPGTWDDTFHSYGINGALSGTNANTTNVQLSKDPYYDSWVGYIAANLIYTTGPTGQVYTGYLLCNDVDGPHQWNDGVISYPNFNGNFSPSIVTIPNRTYAACWIEMHDVVFYCFDYKVRYYYGSYGESCSINRGGGSSGFMAWSQNPYGGRSNKSIRFDNGTPISSSIRTLSTAGKYVQLGNGTNPDASNMYVSSFSPFTPPYSFSTSSALGPLSKDNPAFAVGRGFMIGKGDGSFSYRLDDLNVDGRNIGWVDAPDTSDYGKIDILNGALMTEPFQLNGRSKVVFTERSGFADSAAAANTLGKNDFIRCKVELIDDATGKVVGTIKNISITATTVYSSKALSYRLNTKGMNNRSVRLKITVATNLVDESRSQSEAIGSDIPDSIASKLVHRNVQSNLILTKRFAEENLALAKSSLDELTLEESAIPTCFALAQNYPNPFNPKTVVSYQLPVVSRVILKIYDILGREVATLVDGTKEAGAFSVAFDGARLASGVYIMRLSATPEDGSKPFVQVKKMLLMK